MATGIINNGDYTQEDDSNDDWILKDPQGNIIFRWDESASGWTLENNPLAGLASIDGGLTSSPITNIEGTNLSVDGSGNLNADGIDQVATGTVTATGGTSPAVNTTLQSVSTDQLLDYDVWLYVDSDPAFAADYAFNFDYSHSWDDTNQELDIDLVVNWDTDPGSTNDVTLRWEVIN